MRIKRTVILLMSCLLIVAILPVNVFAAEGKYSSKDEVIYGKLDASGNVNNMYVVNSFAVDKAGGFIDYGNYTNVRNLTDLSTIEQSGSTVKFESVTDFYYQGELEKKPLPWNVGITYILDGKKVTPKDLAGANGNLEIRIETTANKEVDQTFFEYYMLQIGVTLDPVIFKDIQAPEATEANEGKNKLLNFTLLPAQEDVFIISAQVTDLEMDPIDIRAVPASIGFNSPDTDDLAKEMRALANGIKDMNEGVSELSSGVTELRGGATTLSEGSNEFQSGLTELNNSSSELVNGSQQFLNVFKEIRTEMENVPDIPDLVDIEGIPQGLRDTAQEIRELNKALSVLDDAINGIPNGTIQEGEIQELRDVLVENESDETLLEVVDELEATYISAQAVKIASENIPVTITTINEEMAVALDEIADGIDLAMEDLTLLDDIAELQAGLTTIATEYETFHNGLVTYTNGVGELATNYSALNSGTQELANGISELENGVKTLHSGTKKLQDSTSDLPEQFQSEIDAFMDDFDFSDYEPVSFVSNKNEHINVVQFILQTESINMPEVEDEDIVEEESKNLWERFLDLFKK